MGASPADLVDGEREHTCAAVRQVIAVDRGDDCVTQAHVGHSAGKSERLARVERAGPAGLHVAVRARSLVHVSPRIMNVAVRRSQQSPMFGQAASSHTVCSLESLKRLRRSR